MRPPSRSAEVSIVDAYRNGANVAEITYRYRGAVRPNQVRKILREAVEAGTITWRAGDDLPATSFRVDGPGLMHFRESAHRRGVTPSILAVKLLMVIAQEADPEILIANILDEEPV